MAVVMMPIEYLVPHPGNPRKELGDLTELAEDIKINGIYQNLAVMPLNEHKPGEELKYMVLIGHRRLAAAKLAGLKEVPCSIVRNKNECEQTSIMLEENMHRKNLTVPEQAQGFQQLLDFGMDIEDIASKSGFSQTTVRRRLKIAELDQKKLKEVSEGRQLSLTDFDELAKVDSIDKRNELLEKIGTSDFKYAVKSAIQREAEAKAMPDFKAEMRKRGIKPLKDNERWSNKYDKYHGKKQVDLFVWDDTKKYIPENVAKQLYYYNTSYGTIEFYTEHKKAKPIKRTEAEIAYDKKVAAAWGEARMIAATHYELRKAYIEKISVKSRIDIVLKGAAMAAVVSSFSYLGLKGDEMITTMGGDAKAREKYARMEVAFKFFENAEPEQLKMLAYTMFGDSADNTFLDGYARNYPKYSKNYRLLALYKWLEQLGYERSEEETLMMTGKHELFQQDMFNGQEG